MTEHVNRGTLLQNCWRRWPSGEAACPLLILPLALLAWLSIAGLSALVWITGKTLSSLTVRMQNATLVFGWDAVGSLIFL